MNKIVLSLKNIVKQYPGVTALDNFSLDFREGEVHALLGENGAGKSTLIKTISGAITPESGTISINNKNYNQLNPSLAKENGIEVIYQEFNLVDSLSAAENICLGERYGKFVDYNIMEVKAKEIFEWFNININPSTPVGELSTAQQQIVEIAKAVSKNAKILIMDEPSATLTVTEVEYMFKIIRNLKERGVTVIYISHLIDEIFEISDRVTVMRDGCYVETKNTSETSRNDLINLMVGRELKESYPEKDSYTNEIALEVKHLSGNGDIDISFNVKKGEILGLAGLVGAGRTEIARVIFGVDEKESGQIYIDGEPVDIKSPQDAINYGIGLIPEDRKRQGCFLDKSIKWNISFTNLKNISKDYLVDKEKENELAKKYKKVLNIKTPSLLKDVRTLSGGNQQKVVLAKTLAVNSKVIIFDEPTRGIDVGAKQEIYNLMCNLAKDRIAIIMISSDMEELLGMSDRIIVLSEGRMTGEVSREEFSQDYILDLASKG
ncbi:MAG: sugar ABC transporter ATP-binding protein [Firmicutes bacterium]|nr:sugar ABC transporter ATP-binding protein [Bacillota bacterium]